MGKAPKCVRCDGALPPNAGPHGLCPRCARNLGALSVEGEASQRKTIGPYTISR